MKKSLILLGTILPIVLHANGNITTVNSLSKHSAEFKAHLPAGTKPLDYKEYKVNGINFKMFKYLNPSNHTIEEIVINSSGKKVDPKNILNKKHSILSDDITKHFATMTPADDNALFKVSIALTKPISIDIDPIPESGSISLENGNTTVIKNGITLNDKQAKLSDSIRIDKLNKKNLRHQAQRLDVSKKLLKRNAIYNSKAIQTQLEQGRASLVMELTKGQIEKMLKSSGDLIDGIELYRTPVDGIADAMLDTGVDPWAFYSGPTQGDKMGIYMTESGCAPTGHITNYTKLSGSDTAHAQNVTGILRAVSPKSYVYCRGGAVLPSSADLNGYNGHPKIHVATRSNGLPGSNAYTTLDRDWDNLVYNNKVLTFLLAGNNGGADNEIWSPGKGYNVITIGSYNDSTDYIDIFSSFKDPQTHNQKPEIVAPGNRITAGGYTMTGTSMATPHAAAFAADIMSGISWLQFKPALMKALMLSGSIKAVSGPADAVGVGGLNYKETGYNGKSYWWDGANSAFDYYDSRDSKPNNGSIEKKIKLNANHDLVSIAFVWLNRGDYTYTHRTNGHAMGMDFDITIYDPFGKFVASSASFDNAYEMVKFKPAYHGEYTVKITRTRNSDTLSDFHAGLAVQYIW